MRINLPQLSSLRIFYALVVGGLPLVGALALSYVALARLCSTRPNVVWAMMVVSMLVAAHAGNMVAFILMAAGEIPLGACLLAGSGAAEGLSSTKLFS